MDTSAVLCQANQDKTGSGATRKKALERQNIKTDNNHVPTSVDAYTVGALREWFDDRNLAIDLQLSLNKNLLAVKFLRPHQVGVQRCSGAGEGTQGRRPPVPPTDEQNGGGALSRRSF